MLNRPKNWRVNGREVFDAGTTGLFKRAVCALSMLVAAAITPLAGVKSAEAQETLTFAVSTFGGEEFDPVIAKYELVTLTNVMFDSLFDIDENGKLAPGLVKEWEVSPDAMVWTLHLRDDVLFHDGSAFTAEDVVFSLNHAQIELAQRGGLWRKILGTPPQAEILDPYTVRITTPEPQPHFGEFATHLMPPYMFILPKKYIEEHGIEHFRKNPIGTGPYKFVEMIPGQEMVFEAVDYDHWRAEPSFQHIKIVEVPEETTRVAMLETGQIDATAVGLENAARLRDAGYELAEGGVAAAGVNFIGTYLPEAEGMPLSDIRVREALSLAINRQELADVLLMGFGRADVVHAALDWETSIGWTPELEAKWKPIVKETYRYDPEEAKRLIAEAGYPDGFEFTFWVPPDSEAPYLQDLMQAVAGYWSAVGARVDLVQVDSTAWRGVRHTSNSKELVGAGGVNALGIKPIAMDAFTYFTSQYGNMNTLVGAPLEAKVDELILAGWSAVDPAEHEKLFDELLDITINSWTSWPIVYAPNIVAIGPRAEGDLSRDRVNPAYNLPYWKYTGDTP